MQMTGAMKTSAWSCSTKVAFAAALAGGMFTGTDAAACGGLFCSATAPVEQTAERIIFATEGDGRVTAIIEVQYAGPSEKFAWLLPMPGVPEVGVSDETVLQAVDASTEPRYQLERTYDMCEWPEEAEFDDSGSFADAGAPDGDPGIDVLDKGNAGPYDYIIISADPGLEDPAQTAVDWLVEAGYDVFDIGPDVLRPYLAEGLNLVAFRLTKGNDAGAIRPVTLTYDGEKASIPIRPTAVAAQDDMGILVFVLGDERAIPENYLSLQLNESRINWFNWRSNYDDVVSLAADEAGGHGFVTEYAGDTDRLDRQIWDDYMDTAWQNLLASESEGVELMMEARWPFLSYEGFRRAVEEATTLPEGLTLDEFAADPFNDAGATVDGALFLSTLESEVVAPLKQAQQLVDTHPYLTRLYTTLSPQEMTEDPAFVFSENLPEVSNVHEARITYYCDGDTVWPDEAPWTITLPDGSVLSGGSGGAWLEQVEDLPAAALIEQLSESGESNVVVDNRAEIAEALEGLEPAVKPRVDGGVDVDEMGGELSETDTSATDVTSSDPPADVDETDEGDGTGEPAGGASTDADDGTSDHDAGGGDEGSAGSSKGGDDGCSVAQVGSNLPGGSGFLSFLLLGALAARRRR